MALNGQRLDLTDFADYDGEVNSVNGDIEKFIRELP
jgi:hypothetical protein